MHAKAIAHAKSSLSLKNSNSKNISKSILQIIYSCSVQKNAPQSTKYSRKESILKIGHHACKGYSPCKILTLAQKLKFQKTCQNPFYKSFTVVLCKKPLQKTLNIRVMRAFSKSAIMHAKAIAHAKSSLWFKKLKFQKTCQNPFYKSFRLQKTGSLQKTAQKTTKYSRNGSIFKIGHHACKGYSPCKIPTLAQKLKFQKTCQNPFYKSFTVVLCKTRSKKH